VVDSRIKYVLFTLIHVACLARAEQYPFWKQFTDFLKQGPQMTRGSACPEPPNKAVDVFPIKDQALEDRCITEICGSLDLFALAGLKGRPRGSVDFASRYKPQIAAATKRVMQNQSAWLQGQIRELDRKRPFKDLSTEEQILSSYNFLPNFSNGDVRESLTPEENQRLEVLSKDMTPFALRFGGSFERNLQIASNKTSSQIRIEVEQLNNGLKEKFGETPLWNELQEVVYKNNAALSIESAAHSDYYRKALLEQYAIAKTLAEALYNKDQWKTSLHDLGNPGKDFPSLRREYVESTHATDTNVMDAFLDCADDVSDRHARLPSAEKLDLIKAQIEETKQKIIKSFLPRFSAESQSAMRTALQDVKFNLPPTKESYEAAFRAKLETMGQDEFSDNPNQARTTSIYDFSHSQNIAKSIHAQCDREVLAKGMDHAVTGRESVNFSELVNKDDVSAWTIAHELFHVLDPALGLQKISAQSSAEIAKIKSCLADYHGKNTFYLAEDWADGSAAVIASDVKSNPVCEFVFPKTPFTSGENHSPVLFRLLHFELYRKSNLGPACTRFLRKQRPAVDLKKCL
jgi:hypothetical protein